MKEPSGYRRPARLDHATWYEVAEYLESNSGIFLPVGSTEQHGPIGMIGTDAICAEAIARRATERVGAFMAPVLAYTPAPFNMSFPGTLSVSEATFIDLFSEVIHGLRHHGFHKIYVLNAHGANLAPMRSVLAQSEDVRLRSWWDFAAVNAVRDAEFGDWEGLHATPAEISITQALGRRIDHEAAAQPPRSLTERERKARAGDNHGAARLHRQEFPDGRVGAHSAMARPEIGARLLDIAAKAVAEDFLAFTQ